MLRPRWSTAIRRRFRSTRRPSSRSPGNVPPISILALIFAGRRPMPKWTISIMACANGFAGRIGGGSGNSKKSSPALCVRVASKPVLLMIKTPLLQNAPGLRFRNVHDSAGAPRSKHLFCLLHYKFDLDLPGKVEVALRERQYSASSREYEAYARFLSETRFDLRFHGTRRFDGAQSLIEDRVSLCRRSREARRAGDIPLDEGCEPDMATW